MVPELSTSFKETILQTRSKPYCSKVLESTSLMLLVSPFPTEILSGKL